MENPLNEPDKIAVLSRIVERAGPEFSVEQYVRSFSLPSDEEKTVIQSLTLLPALAAAPLGMPTMVVKADPDFWL